jgi:hypothetical protein
VRRWVRNCSDLAEAYSAVDKFSFYFEVVKKTEAEDVADLSSDMRDLDEIVAEAFKKTEAENGVMDHKKMREKRKRDGFSFAANKNQQTTAYNTQHESCDLSMTFSSALEFGQMVYGAVGRHFATHRTDGQKALSDLPYAPSKVFNLAAIYDRCEAGMTREQNRLPTEHRPVQGAQLQPARRGLPPEPLWRPCLPRHPPPHGKLLHACAGRRHRLRRPEHRLGHERIHLPRLIFRQRARQA